MKLFVTLKPYPAGDSIEKMDVTLCVDGLAAKKGEALFHFNTQTVKVPCAPPQRLLLADAQGEIAVDASGREHFPILSTDYAPVRDVAGNWQLSYTVTPRVLPEDFRYGPYFDFRAEPGGVNGPGKSFLPNIPAFNGEMSVHWDFSLMPQGCKAACAWGEGDFTIEGDTSLMDNAYYAFGDLHSVTQGEFGFYWFTQPSFDLNAVAEYTRTLFGYMQEVFRDDKENYRIFTRRDPFERSGGGTALYRSYMFGYSAINGVTEDHLKNLLAHEMVHNWPHINDSTNYGSGTWYNEGTAEFYSIMLPYRLGLVDAEFTREQVAQRLDAYLANPLCTMDSVQAAKLNWSDRRAQRMAYGRGVMFVANVDAMIRAATDGKKSMDDVVRDLVVMHREGKEPYNEDFLASALRISGLDLTAQLESMSSGVQFAPDDACFDGLFTFTPKQLAQADTGKIVTGYDVTLR